MCVDSSITLACPQRDWTKMEQSPQRLRIQFACVCLFSLAGIARSLKHDFSLVAHAHASLRQCGNEATSALVCVHVPHDNANVYRIGSAVCWPTLGARGVSRLPTVLCPCLYRSAPQRSALPTTARRAFITRSRANTCHCLQRRRLPIA
eukprot:IDg8587t1